jgi:phage terminase large subunit-like protein
MKDYCADARQYVDDVLSGKQVACEWIRLACERSKSDHAKYVGADSPYRFDEKKAARICAFAEKLKVTEDAGNTKAGDFFLLQQYQTWMLCEIFGWVYNDATQYRRFQRAVFMCGRGNGKSAFASIISLFTTFAEKVGGAEGVCCASQREQATLVFSVCKEMLRLSPDITRTLGLKIESKKISQPKSNSRLFALPAKASSAEGLKPTLATLDELHLQRGRSLYETLGSGVTKRGGDSLYLLVSTAGDDVTGIGFELVEHLRRVLSNESEDENTFVAMYGADDEEAENWTSPVEWEKANPSWGVTLQPKSIEVACKRAKSMPGEKRNFLIRHLSSWLAGSGADEDFFDASAVQACYDATLKEADFLGSEGTLGVDVASTEDLSAIYHTHMRKNKEGLPVYYAFGRNFLPAKKIRESQVAALATMVARGEVISSGEGTTRQADISAYILDVVSKFKIRDCSYDPFQATGIVETVEDAIQKRDFMIKTAQTGKVLTPGIRLLADAIADGRFKTNDSCLLWCLRNVRCRTINMNWLQTVRPEKIGGRRDQKIDSAAALIMSFVSIAVLQIGESKKNDLNRQALQAAEERAQGLVPSNPLIFSVTSPW